MLIIHMLVVVSSPHFLVFIFVRCICGVYIDVRCGYDVYPVLLFNDNDPHKSVGFSFRIH